MQTSSSCLLSFSSYPSSWSSASSSAPTEQQFPFNIVIGISCGGIFILALIAIYLVRRSQRRKKAKQRRFLDGMPGDVAFPRPEKYELEDQKEDVAHYEEVPISPIGVRYEELGFSNEAAYCEEVDIWNDAGQSEEIRISNDADNHDVNPEKGTLEVLFILSLLL